MEFTSPVEITSLEDLKNLPESKEYAVLSKSFNSIHLTVFPDIDWYLEAGVHFFGNDGDITVYNAFGDLKGKEWILYGSLNRQGQSWRWETSLKEIQFGATEYSENNPKHSESKAFVFIINFILQDEKEIKNKLLSLGISGWDSIGFSDSEKMKIIKWIFRK